MSSSLKIISLNVRGLRNQTKRSGIFSYLKNQKATLYCLQETFSLEKDENIWSAEWGGQTLFAHGSEHSRGVCILLKSNAQLSLHIIYSDPNGRYIIAKLKVGDKELFVVNIYAPNQHNEKLAFIKNLVPDLEFLNCTLTPKDKAGGLPWSVTEYRNSITRLMKEFGLNDIYRKLHPNTRAFTYESKSFKMKSRIDYFLISDAMTANVKKAEIRQNEMQTLLQTF